MSTTHRTALRRATAVLAAAAGAGLVAVLPAGALPAGALTIHPGTMPGATHVVRVGGIGLTVPAGWHLADPRDGQRLPGCIVAPRVRQVPAGDAPYGIDRCQLQVFTGRALDARADADDLYFQGDPVVCHAAGRSVSWRTALAGSAPVGRARAEYRRFTLPCTHRPAEQWVLGGAPAAIIQRTSTNPATERAVRQAIVSATVPARRAGYALATTGLARLAGPRVVAIAPVRLYRNGDHTSSYHQATGRSVRIVVPRTTITFTDRHLDTHSLTRAQYLRDVRVGFPTVTTGYRAITVVSSPGGARVDEVRVEVAAQP